MSEPKPWSAWTEAEREGLEAAFVARHGAELLLDGDPEPPSATGSESPAGTQRGCRRLPFARLHASLHGGGPLPPDVSAALRADPGLRDDFALLVRRSARRRLPRAAAAAGHEGLLRREAGGFVVRLVASRAGRDQVYLLVELPEDATAGAETAGDPGAGLSGRKPGEGRAGAGRLGVGVPAHDPEDGSGPDDAPHPVSPVPHQLVVRTAGGEFLKQALPSPGARTIRLVLAEDDQLVRAVGEPASELFLL